MNPSESVDKALVANEPYRSVAKTFGVSAPSVLRHKKHHLSSSLVRAQKAKEAASADNLLADICKLKSRAERILKHAEEEQDHRIALSAIRELRSTIELLARISGELRDTATVNVLITPEYQSLRTTIIQTLAPYPEARLAISNALKEHNHDTR